MVDNGIRVWRKGIPANRRFPSLGAAVAFALDRAYEGKPGDTINVTEHDEMLYYVRRTKTGAVVHSA